MNFNIIGLKSDWIGDGKLTRRINGFALGKTNKIIDPNSLISFQGFFGKIKKMTEEALDKIIMPLQNGETAVLRPREYPFGKYEIEVYRHVHSSQVTLTSDQPLTALAAKLENREEAEEKEDWQLLKNSLGNTYKLVGPETMGKPGEEKHVLRLASNQWETPDFCRFVVTPMTRLGILPREVALMLS